MIDAEGTVRALLEQAQRPAPDRYGLPGQPGGRDVPATGWTPATAARSTPNGSSSPPAGGCPRSWTGSRCPPRSARSCHRCRSARRTPTTSPTGKGWPSWPTFIHKNPAISTYGLPGGRDAGFRGQKIAEFLGGRRIASAADQDGVVDPANRTRIVDYVRQYLPGLHPEPYAETTCLFTSTPNEDFLIDGTDGITLVSPCSGHGAKFAPLIGDIAADVATGEARAPDRFTVRALDAASRR